MTRDEKLKRITVLWAERLSTSVIAKRLGLPKGTVCGAVLRARLRGDPRFPLRDRKGQPAPMQTPTPTPIVVKPAPKRQGPPRIYELRDGECKFPVDRGGEFDEHLFCAASRALDSPYCERHHREAHTRSN